MPYVLEIVDLRRQRAEGTGQQAAGSITIEVGGRKSEIRGQEIEDKR